jgi:PilZ domain
MPLLLNKVLPFPRDNPAATILNWPVPAERRSKVRYPLDLSVRFRYFSGGSLLFGVGRTADVSSSGVLVLSPRVLSPNELSVGVTVEMNIEWPPLLDGRISLQLFAVGWVVRRRPFDFAASFSRHQLRTVKSSSQPADRLVADVTEWLPAS